MSLTEALIQKAKPREKPYKLSDGKGLCLLVNPTGSLWWRFRYRFDGKEKMLALGSCLFPKGFTRTWDLGMLSLLSHPRRTRSPP